MARGIFRFSKILMPANIELQDPNSLEGHNIARVMTSTSMMAIVGLLEKILTSKATEEKKVKDQKESFQKVSVIVHSYARTC